MSVQYPILDELLRDGAIFVFDGKLIGIASDGVEVLIGSVFDPESAERYLTDFPSPDMW